MTTTDPLLNASRSLLRTFPKPLLQPGTLTQLLATFAVSLLLLTGPSTLAQECRPGLPRPQPRSRPIRPTTPLAAPRPFVCQVWFSPDQPPASGVLVATTAQYALVATSRHVADYGIYAVRFPGRGDYQIREGWHDKLGYDLAILRIDAVSVRPVEFGSRPSTGQTVILAGYARGIYVHQSGPVLQFTLPGPGQRFGDLTVAAATPNGTSGGAMLDTSGRLLGILWGTECYGKADSIGVSIEAVREFVDRVHQQLAGRLHVPDEAPAALPIPQASPAAPCEYYAELVPIVNRHTKRLADLAAEIAAIRKMQGPPGQDGLDGKPGARGEKGDLGPTGTSGHVTVLVVDSDDVEIFRHERVVSGSTVKLKLEGSN